MPEHVHLLLHPPPGLTSAQILKAIKQPVSQKGMSYLRAHNPSWLKRLEMRWPTGRIEYHFWEQGGGYDRNIITTETAWASVNYIHANPVRKGLVDLPEQWPSSSACWYAGVKDVVIQMDGIPE